MILYIASISIELEPRDQGIDIPKDCAPLSPLHSDLAADYSDLPAAHT